MGLCHKSCGQVCHRVAGKGAKGERVVGRARGPTGQEGAVGRPGRTPPLPIEPALVVGALCWAEPSHSCGSCPMPGGTLQKMGRGPENPTESAVRPCWRRGSRLRRPCGLPLVPLPYPVLPCPVQLDILVMVTSTSFE